MLAILKGQSVFGIPIGENRLFSLLRIPMLGSNTFADGGQGPEKPIIEEVDIEEEIFTFPYPEEEGEISDIVNPPIKGIAGKVSSAQGKVTINLDFSNIFDYIFISSKEEALTKIPEHEFISLTTQSAIASYYISLLVYNGYTTNASFSYASNDVYEMPSSPRKTAYDGPNKPLYEARSPMPIFSERVFYHRKEENKIYVTHSTQSRLLTYQDSIQETINIESLKFYVGNFSHKNNIGNFDLKSDIKLNYKIPELELNLVRNKRLVSNKGNENVGDELIAHFLPDCPNAGVDIASNRIQPRFDVVALPKYEGITKYKVNLPLNLGFDDPLLRDRFIAKLNIQAPEVGYKPIRLETQLPDSRFLVERYNATENENSVRYKQRVFANEAGLPTLKSIEFSILPEELVFDPRNQITYTSKTDNLQIHQSEVSGNNTQFSLVKELVLECINPWATANPDYEVLQKEKADDGKVIAPKTSYRITSLDFILNHSLMQQIAYEMDEPSTKLYTLNILFECPLLIGNVFSPLREEQVYLRGVTYNTIKPQTSYHDNYAPNNTIRQNSDRTRSDLESLVRVNYDNGRLHTSSTANNLSNYYLSWINANSEVLNLMTTSIANPTYIEFSTKEALEEAVEQEMELTQEESNQNVQAEAHNGNKADTETVYEKNELKEEQETETNGSDDPSVSDLALTAGAVGLGILAGAAGLFGALFKKDNDEEINPNKLEGDLYKSKEGEVKKNCSDKSQCFADTIDWLEGKLKNLTISDEEYESFSQCYSEEIKNIQKAREYIKKREGGYSCNGALHHLFYHIGFTTEQEKKYKLKGYVRDGEVQEGFELATTITVGGDIEGDYDIEVIWEDDVKEGESENLKLKRNSTYAQLDIGLRKQGYTPIWKIMSYIDTDTGGKRSGLYLETIAELHLEAKELLGDKDEHGMKLMGIILLINGQEPGQGTISMHNYPIKLSDRIDVLFKNDSAWYDTTPKISKPVIKEDFLNYLTTERTPEKNLEAILV